MRSTSMGESSNIMFAVSIFLFVIFLLIPLYPILGRSLLLVTVEWNLYDIQYNLNRIYKHDKYIHVVACC